MTDLKGKVALVTGGGTGIGGAVARRFVNRGAQVVVVGRRVDVVEQLASEIGALALQCDVGVTASVEQTIAQLVERCGGLDIVVNNAATVQIGNVEQLDDAAWSSVVEVNVNGPMRVARAAIPHLRARGGGSIVNVSSIGGLFAAKNSAVYGTTKAALLGLTRSLARDYGREGIRVNTLCPGWVDTPMVEPRAADDRRRTRNIDRCRARLCWSSTIRSNAWRIPTRSRAASSFWPPMRHRS